MRTLIALVLGGVVSFVPVTLQGWGMDVHRFLTRRAIEGLPPAVRPLFAPKVDFIAEHSADPDLWRVVALKGAMGEEDPNHYLDIDGLDEPAPFANVPRDWTAFVARYGLDRANKAGRVPWRAEEIDGLLVKAFQSMGTAPYALDNARYLAGVLSHYIEDAHVPFHAVMNHDGQLTNQRGIHSRWETELVLRNLETLKLTPVAITPVPSVKTLIFDAIVSGERLAPGLLDADRQAAAGREFYDDAYFARLLRDTRPVLEARMSEAASAVASAIVSAWERGGKPAAPPDGPRPPARIRR